MEFIGFLLALIIGIVLGLLGGGGSILAVPVLAYLFMLDEKVLQHTHCLLLEFLL